MIKSAKRCLKKSTGKNCLSYGELHTLVVEIEAVLNSRPLTYVASEDIEEPLTPSHRLVGYRILTLPDPPITEEDDSGDSPDGLTRRASHLTRTLRHFGIVGRRNTYWSFASFITCVRNGVLLTLSGREMSSRSTMKDTLEAFGDLAG